MKTYAALLFALFSFPLLHAQNPDTAWIGAVTRRVEVTLYAGDFQQGENIAAAALDSARTLYGPETLETAEMLDLLGVLQFQTYQYEAFEQTVLQCLGIWRKIYGNRHEKVAHGLSQLALARFRLGQYDSADTLFTQARDLLEGLGLARSEDMAVVCSNMAAYFELNGAYLKAESLHLQALHIETDMFGDRRFQYSNYTNDLAVLYGIVKRCDEALYYYDASLRNMDQFVGKDHPDYILTLKNKGMALVDAGRYHEAETILTQTLAAARKIIPPGDAELSYYLLALSHLYNQTGQFDESIRLETESAQLLKNQYGPTNPRYIRSFLKMGILYSEFNKLSLADSMLHEVMGILETTKRDQTMEYSQALAQLGKNYLREQRYAESRTLLEAAAALGEKILGKDQPQYHWTYGAALARLNLVENRPDEALRLLDAARDPIMDSYGKEHDRFIALETLYGRAWQGKSNAQQALQYFKAAFDALQTNLSENFSYLSVDERENFARSFEGYQSAFLAFARSFPNDPSVQSFLYNMTLFQKELLASYDRQLFNDWHQNPDSSFQVYVGLRRMIARQWTLPVAKRVDLSELEARRVALEKSLSINSTLNAASGGLISAQWQQVQQALQPGDAAIEWLSLPPTREGYGASCYAALLLRPGFSAPELVLLPEVDQINALFASKGSRGLQYATRTYSADALYRSLWQPLETRLTGVHRIFYAPGGALHLLNFDAIQISGGQLLTDKYDLVRVANTARLLDTGFGKNLSGVGSALLAGGLDYESATKLPGAQNPGLFSRSGTWRGGTTREWEALPNTLPEVERLGALLQLKRIKTTVLTGRDGSEPAVKAYCTDNAPGILHFATHGFFFEKNTAAPGSLGLVTAENPMFRSGLILAGANPAWRGEPMDNNAEDGILTADEIALLPLQNTALVVLSACETGLGDVQDDEGVYGLQRAFRLAGAQNIVMSLWRVPDVQTRQFMEKFYAVLQEKGDIRQAFREARQAMRKEYGNPYYWAGFVLLE